MATKPTKNKIKVSNKTAQKIFNYQQSKSAPTKQTQSKQNTPSSSNKYKYVGDKKKVIKSY